MAVPERAARPLSQPTASAQVILDAADRIVAETLSAHDHLLLDRARLEGRPLRDVLLSLNPAWEPELPARFFAEESPLFLPQLPASPDGFGLAVRRLRFGDRMAVALSPELAPAALLGQSGAADLRVDRLTFSQLLLRHRVLEDRLHHYLFHLPAVAFRQRADLSFSFIGPGFEALTGARSAIFRRDGRSFADFVHEDDRPLFGTELARRAAQRRPFNFVFRLQHRASGAIVYILDARSPLFAPGGLLLGYEGVWLDITRQKTAENRLSCRAWKETLSTLSTGLLHDFGNMMTGITSLSELYETDRGGDEPRPPENLALIRESAQQAHRLVRKIIDLHRETTGERSWCSARRLLTDQAELVRIALPKGTRLSLELPEEELALHLDELAFRQTIVNFALNSRDALTGPGVIRLAARCVDEGDALPPGLYPAPPRLDCRHVEIVFADNGAGIPPEHLEHIFDPFFTTKDSHRGSGLGLYNARLFAQAHAGHLGARPRAGGGTEMVLLLPLAEIEAAVPEAALADAAPAPEPPPRRLRILYYEPGIIEEPGLTQLLRDREWEVRAVMSEPEYRAYIEERGASLDVVFLRHPRLDATLATAIDHLRERCPNARLALDLSGQNPEEAPASLRKKVDLLLPFNQPIPLIADAVARAARQP